MLSAALLALALVAGGCSDDVDLPPPRASAAATGDRGAGAQEALDRLLRAVADGSAGEAERVAAPGAAALLSAIVANGRSLDVQDLAMRYVDEGPPLDATRRARLGSGAWIGSVEVRYAFGDGEGRSIDEAPARTEVPVVFVPVGGEVRIAGTGAEGERTPLWLAERLTVVRSPHTLVAVAGPAGRYPRLAERAVAQVRRTLPDWRGRLVVEVPGSREPLDAALDAEAGEYDAIAAVTTTEDGSLASGAPVRVLVNPDVYDGLAARGAQVVMSHEATHVATKATFADLPTWLLEGFADYVALDRAGVPVRRAAGQILPRIRTEGLPDRLPTAADLDPRADGLGATYEEAWLACRFLAQEYGQARLIRFYRTVSGGETTARAFRQVLGTTEKQFVAAWRVDLARLAGVPVVEPNA